MMRYGFCTPRSWSRRVCIPFLCSKTNPYRKKSITLVPTELNPITKNDSPRSTVSSPPTPLSSLCQSMTIPSLLLCAALLSAVNLAADEPGALGNAHSGGGGAAGKRRGRGRFIDGPARGPIGSSSSSSFPSSTIGCERRFGTTGGRSGSTRPGRKSGSSSSSSSSSSDSFG